MDNSTKYIIFTGVCTTFILSSYHAMASDDYLKMLESEAAETTIDQSNEYNPNLNNKNKLVITDETKLKKPVNKMWAGECNYTDDVLPLNLSQEEFSSFLKKCALGSSIFYRRLNPASQEAVYRNYKKPTPVKLSIIRKDIQKHF